MDSGNYVYVIVGMPIASSRVVSAFIENKVNKAQMDSFKKRCEAKSYTFKTMFEGLFDTAVREPDTDTVNLLREMFPGKCDRQYAKEIFAHTASEDDGALMMMFCNNVDDAILNALFPAPAPNHRNDRATLVFGQNVQDDRATLVQDDRAARVQDDRATLVLDGAFATNWTPIPYLQGTQVKQEASPVKQEAPPVRIKREAGAAYGGGFGGAAGAANGGGFGNGSDQTVEAPIVTVLTVGTTIMANNGAVVPNASIQLVRNTLMLAGMEGYCELKNRGRTPVTVTVLINEKIKVAVGNGYHVDVLWGYDGLIPTVFKHTVISAVFCLIANLRSTGSEDPLYTTCMHNQSFIVFVGINHVLDISACVYIAGKVYNVFFRIYSIGGGPAKSFDAIMDEHENSQAAKRQRF